MCFKKFEVIVTVENIFTPDYLFDHTVTKLKSRCVGTKKLETYHVLSLLPRKIFVQNQCVMDGGPAQVVPSQKF